MFVDQIRRIGNMQVNLSSGPFSFSDDMDMDKFCKGKCRGRKDKDMTVKIVKIRVH